ncbi:hypothetical protein LBMAG42_48540 [Deltaproteobacteria bacterium]|nr:hypothetical protein LBMAG42_48540 [Deltaproteobacteria bacterium]
MRARHVALGVAILAGAAVGGGVAWRVRHPLPPETSHAAALSTIAPLTGEVVRSDWLAEFWSPERAKRGGAMAGAPAEQERAARCATCHVAQAAAWATSRHAMAMGPGVTGQGLDHGATVAACGSCHAPLAEQATDSALASEGVTCAACHVRAGTYNGPPAAVGTVPAETPTHADLQSRPEYTDPAFCTSCHDFSASAAAPAGKRLQETTEEWRRTPAAAAGQSCQTCHMPGGEHSWKGIHDPELVKSAFTAKVKFMTDGGLIVGKLTVTASEAVGHRLPTYTTPELWLTIDQLDHDGLVLPGTHREGVIGRRMSADNTEEQFDTRLFPGESKILVYEAQLEEDCTSLIARVEVRPDAAYELRYAGWIEQGKGDESQLKSALEAAKAARYVAWQERVVLPG